jgi:hypothetical protein
MQYNFGIMICISKRLSIWEKGYKFLGPFLEAFGVSCKWEKQSLSLLQFMVFQEVEIN